MNSSAQMIFDMSDVESKENIPQKKLISKYDFSQVFEGQINNEYHNNNSMVILGDSLDVLKKMKSKTVQLIFADAPYNIGKNFGNNLDKWKNVNDYVEWCKRWLDECFRILSDDGTIYFMTATQHMPFLDVYISEKYNVLCRIVWAYDSSGMQSKKIFGSLYEPILMANKSKKSKYTFNQNDILVEAYSPMAHGQVLNNEVIMDMAKKYNVSVAALCIRYVIQLGTVALPKTANVEYMKDNASVDFNISEEDMEILKNIEAIKDYGEFSYFPVFSGK